MREIPSVKIDFATSINSDQEPGYGADYVSRLLRSLEQQGCGEDE